MENDDGGMRYSDHLYYRTLPADEEECDDDLLLRFEKNMKGLGFCDGVEKSKHVDVDVDVVEGRNAVESLEFNGKDYSTLNMNDMKDVGFTSIEEAERFYRLYSRICGFSVRRDRMIRQYFSEFFVRREWVCSKQGMSKTKSKKQGEKEMGKSPIKVRKKRMMMKKVKRNQCPRGIRYSRVGCLAGFGIRYCNKGEMYVVSKFITEHNHDLVVPEEVQFLRCHREVKEHVLVQVEALRQLQVPITRIYELLVVQAGGQEFLGFTLRDLYNALTKRKRAADLDGDAQSALTWMQIRVVEEKQFYCNYSLDEEGRLANLFWRDRQSLLDYEAYGDVVIMDSTYKTNIYGKPLVVFVGSNNHRATVIFGFALIGDEKEHTYSWVFQEFVAAMNQKHPISVLTDGDEAIRNVVEKVMPTARHRLCAWHIGRNIGQNVKGVEVQESLGKLIYASFTVQDWEVAWHALVEKHGLGDNVWVTSLYNKRER